MGTVGTEIADRNWQTKSVPLTPFLRNKLPKKWLQYLEINVTQDHYFTFFIEPPWLWRPPRILGNMGKAHIKKKKIT